MTTETHNTIEPYGKLVNGGVCLLGNMFRGLMNM